MKQQPVFSIVTICYNSAATIEQTIKSVLTQTYQDYEYIIVDGGSKDVTLDIIQKYEPLFEGRLQWKSEPDKGIYDAMNKGVMKASGVIVGIVNSDDWLEPDALSTVYDIYVKNGRSEDCLYCGGIYYHKDGVKSEMRVNLDSFHRNASMYIMSGVRHPATFVPKKIYEKVGLYDSEMKLSADQDFILRCFFAGIRFEAIKSCLSNMAAGGISTIGNKKSWQCSKNDRKHMLRKLDKSGFTYLWLYYTWYLRNKIRLLAIKCRLYTNA